MNVKVISPRTLMILLLSLMTVAVYGEVLQYEFVLWDDPGYVYKYPWVTQGLQRASILWALSATEMGLWHPLTWFSLMGDVSLFGLDPAGHHLMNLIFHVLSGCLLFFLLDRMTAAKWPSAFVAAVFLLHPVNVESVAWIAERKNVLSTFFWMFSMLAYLRYVERPGRLRYGMVAISLAMGLLAKPMLVTLPFVFLLLDVWPLGRWRFAARVGFPWVLIKEKIPLIFLSAIAAGMTIYTAAAVSVIAATELLPIPVRLANASISYLKYMEVMLWPRDLIIFYPHPVNWFSVRIVMSLLVLLVVTAGVIYKCRDYPYLFTGWFWYLGTLVPVIGFIQVGAQAWADRYAYIPLIGLFIMAAWGIPDLLHRFPYRRIILSLGTGLIICTLAWTTIGQLANWRNNFTLFGHAIQVSPQNYLAHDLLGVALMEQGRLTEAKEHFEAAIQAKVDFESPYGNLGLVMMRQGQTEKAIHLLETAISYSPGRADLQFSLAEALLKAGRREEAVTAYRKAASLRPDWVQAQNNLGIALAEGEKDDDAAAAFKKAIALDPSHAGAHNNLGMILVRQGRSAEAIAEFREAVRLQPNYAHAHYQLAEALSEAGLREEAAKHAQWAARINPAFGGRK